MDTSSQAKATSQSRAGDFPGLNFNGALALRLAKWWLHEFLGPPTVLRLDLSLS